MNPSRLVVDTNVFFSLLLRRETPLRRWFLADSRHVFYCPRFFLVELFKHKERIVQASELGEGEILDSLHEMLVRLHFIDEDSISVGVWVEARRLCRGIDPKDTPFVALALHLDCRLWTGDDQLKSGLRRLGFDRFFAR